MKYDILMSDYAFANKPSKSCRLILSLPLAKKHTKLTNIHRQVFTEGCLTYREGSCLMRPVDGILSAGNLELYVEENPKIILFKFIDALSLANSSGDGAIYRDMCLSFRPGEIFWTLES